MRILDTEEMQKLRKVFEPYEENKRFRLKPNAPKEAKEAFDKYNELFDAISKEEEEAILAEFDR